MTKYDDDIHEAEARLVQDRRALVAQVEALSMKARETASSPKGLVVAVVVGFVLGELTAPRRSKKYKSNAAQAADTTKKMGLGGLIGSALFAYARSQYGSPWAMGRSLWSYYAATRKARQGATTRAPAATRVAPPVHVSPAGAPVSASPAYSSPVRSPESHVAG